MKRIPSKRSNKGVDSASKRIDHAGPERVKKRFPKMAHLRTDRMYITGINHQLYEYGVLDRVLKSSIAIFFCRSLLGVMSVGASGSERTYIPDFPLLDQ